MDYSQCNETYARDELELLSEKERDDKRLAAVRELVRTSIRRNGRYERDMEYAKALEALAAVWPEAVDADETSQAEGTVSTSRRGCK